MKDYKNLLEEAKKKLPEVKATGERFEIPKVKTIIQGNKTVITNFSQIASTLRRPADQIVKYLQREIATPACLDSPRLYLGRKISDEIINKKIIHYCNDFVLCKECKKPDTKIIKEDRFLFMKCMACGARHPIKSKI